MLLAPDGKSLFVVCGNQTRSSEFTSSRVPPNWGEDQLDRGDAGRQRVYAGRARLGGAIHQVDPDGKNWVVIVGFRTSTTGRLSIVTAICSRMTPTWSGISIRPGIGQRRLILRPVEPSSAGGTARESGRLIIPTARHPSLTSAQARRPA